MLKSLSKPITIGMVLSTVPKYSETFFRNKILGLQKDGFKVILFVDYNNNNANVYDCEVVTGFDFSKGKWLTFWFSLLALVKSLCFHPSKSLKLFRLNKQDGISIVKNIRQLILNEYFFNHKVDWLHFGFGMLAVNRENLAEAAGAKMAVSFRGYDLYLSPLKHPNCYNLLFQKVVKYHVLSQEMKKDLIAYKINASNIKVITPAIDIELFQAQQNEKNTPQVKLVTVARLHWKKGLEYTLEALVHLKNKGVNFHYTVIGAGEERERLIYAAHQLEVINHISFVGKLTQLELKQELLNNSIYLQYSIQEGFCNSVLEAQALGLMCVVSDAEGLSENVLDQKTGWVVPKRNPKLLAEKILYVIDLSQEKKEQIRRSAIDRVKTDFNLEKQQLEFVDFYSE